MKQTILDLLENKNYGLSVNEIIKKLSIHNFSVREIKKGISILEEKGEIFRNKNSKFVRLQETNYKVGKLYISEDGNGAVITNSKETIYIKKKDLMDSKNEDIVIVDKTNNSFGKIIKVKEKNLKSVVGELIQLEGKYCIINREKEIIYVDELNGAVEGSIVVVRPYYEISENTFDGRIESIVCDKNHPKKEILSIVAKYGLRIDFPPNVIEEANLLGMEVRDEDILGRENLEDEIMFTIDGKSAKDFDDAVSLVKLPNGNYLYRSYIADVSHYVKPGTNMFTEAYARGFSKYLEDYVIPMLPENISNNLCSLRENERKLVMVFESEKDQNLNTVNFRVFPAYIKSKMRMRYDELNDIYDDTKEVEEGLRERYEPFKPMLDLLLDFSNKLLEESLKCGRLDFQIDEPEISLDDLGNVINIDVRKRGVWERVIENCMITTNTDTTIYLEKLGIDLSYRVEEEPSIPAIKQVIELLKILGYSIDDDIDEITSDDVQKIVETIKTKENGNILSEYLLMAMKKAKYSSKNTGHFALSLNSYAHYTSPIRRFSDLINHCAIKDKILNMPGYNVEYLIEIASLETSEIEKAIICVEQEVGKLAKAEYMEKRIGEEFTGVVSRVLESGIIVRLANSIEGVVSTRSLPGKFIFDKNKNAFVNKTGIKYGVGDKANVRVSGVSKVKRKVFFEMN